MLAAALTCLRLGWWQWDVFGEARGTGQNLGYALLWPVFAGSFIYMWLKFLHLEDLRLAEEREAGEDGSARPEAGTAAEDASVSSAVILGRTLPPALDGDEPIDKHSGRLSAHTVGLGYVTFDDDDDPELAAYNRALAELAEEDERRGR